MKIKFLPALALVAILLAGTVAHSQTLASSDTGNPNFTLSAGATWLRADFECATPDKADLYGGTLAFAWNINRNNKVQIEAGFQEGSAQQFDLLEYYDGSRWRQVRDQLKSSATSVFLSYSYSIPFGGNDRFAVHFTPTIGALQWKLEDANGGGQLFDQGTSTYHDVSHSDKDVVFAYGIGVGFTFHISKQFSVDLAYRFACTQKTSFTFNNAVPNPAYTPNIHAGTGYPQYFDESFDFSLGKLTTHSLTLSFGYKF